MYARFGLDPTPAQLDEVRALLARKTSEESTDEHTLVMKYYCVLLFNNGSVDDVLPIWRAKESGWDAHFSIDVQLLCGAGLAETKAYLAAHPSEEAKKALDYLSGCENTGDFDNFTPEERSKWYRHYYEPLA